MLKTDLYIFTFLFYVSKHFPFFDHNIKLISLFNIADHNIE